MNTEQTSLSCLVAIVDAASETDPAERYRKARSAAIATQVADLLTLIPRERIRQLDEWEARCKRLGVRVSAEERLDYLRELAEPYQKNRKRRAA